MTVLALALALVLVLVLVLVLTAVAEAGPGGSPTAPPPQPRYPELQLAFHGGLLQPLLTRGFNAGDVRHKRLVLSYSHGEGLEVTDLPGALPDAQREAGVRVSMPWTTGGGVGLTLVDELYVMGDVKVHRFEVDTGLDPATYETLTLGAELGYRGLVWRGLVLTPVLRYWGTVWFPQAFADRSLCSGRLQPGRHGHLVPLSTEPRRCC